MTRNLGQPLTTLAIVAAAVSVAWSPPASSAQEIDRGGLRRPLVTVHLKNGEHVTLRDALFLRLQEGERPPSGSRPPNTPVGPMPGNKPGADPGDDPGATWPRGRDPRQPTHGFSGKPRGAGDYLGSGLSTRELHLIRRVDIHRVEEGITYADITYKNGKSRVNAPMTWTAIGGWERPGQQGQDYFFEAEEILYLEFPAH